MVWSPHRLVVPANSANHKQPSIFVDAHPHALTRRPCQGHTVASRALRAGDEIGLPAETFRCTEVVIHGQLPDEAAVFHAAAFFWFG
jgi:hypothetical protein